jgi:hypothetical protein
MLLSSDTCVWLKVLGAHSYGFYAFALWNTNDIGASAFFLDSADFAVEPFMGHAFLYARIHLYDYLRPGSVFLKNLSDMGLASCTNGFTQQTAGTRVIAF